MLNSDELQPLVSVIVPLYNRAGTIGECLNSLLAQTHRPIEVIIVDDGSRDDSAAVVQAWQQPRSTPDFTVRLLQQSNQGACAARNAGKNVARGEFLQYLDSDDTLEPEKIAEQVIAMRAQTADVAVCDFRYVYEQEGREKIVRHHSDLRWHVASGGSVSTFAPLIRRALFQRVNWSRSLKRHQDIDYFLKIFCLARRPIHTPGVFCNYRIHGTGQISDSYALKDPLCFERLLSLLQCMAQNITRLPARNYWLVTVGAACLFGRQLKQMWLTALGRR